MRGIRGVRTAAVPGMGFESGRYLAKWAVVATAIGVVAGVGALVFFWSIERASSLFLGLAVGYVPPLPVGEGATVVSGMARPWALPLVTALGGLISGIIIFTLAPEAEGHGTDAAIEAIHHKAGRIRARIPPIKLIASAITIGSGGSGGREGPTAQISAGFGSFLADRLHLSAADRRIAVAAGMGAGIGAIFRAPLGGAVLSAEILYLHDLEVEALLPGLIASIVGYTVFGAAFGFQPIFGAQPSLALDSPVELVYYAVLGVLCGGVGLLYARGFYGIADAFHHLRVPNVFKPAIGGAIVGLIGLALPGALATGYGWVQLVMDQRIFDLPLIVILVLPFARILATALSIGSGGSGGIFGPGMVIGAMVGASFWRLAHDFLPLAPASPAPFVIVGMMALFGGIAHAPLAVMLMVAEMTGNLSLLAPAMIAVAVSSALVGDNTIYRSQIPNRASSPFHRVRFSFPLLSSLLVRDAQIPTGPVLTPRSTLEEAEIALKERPRGVVVCDEIGSYLGALTADRLRQLRERGAERVGEDLIEHRATIGPEETLEDALTLVGEQGVVWIPVVDDGRPVGRISPRDALTAYKDTLGRSVRRASELPNDTALLEARIGERSPLARRSLREAQLPVHTLVASINRDGETIFPSAETRLEVGDLVLLLTDPESEVTLRAYLEG